MDGLSLLPHLRGTGGHDKIYCEYTGEGTIQPLMMIKDGPWKYVVCPADEPQLFNLERDPLELTNLARTLKKLSPRTAEEAEAQAKLREFESEALERWDFDEITRNVLHSQRKRRLVWNALKKGKFTSWDYNPVDDGTMKYVSRPKWNTKIANPVCRYIRSHIPLDDLERRARYPPVDMYGRETDRVLVDQAGSHGE